MAALIILLEDQRHHGVAMWGVLDLQRCLSGGFVSMSGFRVFLGNIH